MEINQVKFGNYTIGSYGARQNKGGNKAENNFTPETGSENLQTINPEEMFNAMNIAGLHNRVQINTTRPNEVNPADYLDESRISDIEAMMEGFENGVNVVSEIIGEEFPNLSEADKNALAAQVFAKE